MQQRAKKGVSYTDSAASDALVLTLFLLIVVERGREEDLGE
jgi:hypothetical protein